MAKLSKAKKGIVIACAVFVLALVVTMIMASRIPQSKKIESLNGNIINAVTFPGGDWLYATSAGEMVHLDADNQVIGQKNIVTLLGEEYGFKNGQLRQIYRAEGSDEIWGIMSTMGESVQRYIFKSSWNGGELKLLASQPFTGNVDNSYFLAVGDRFYVLCTGQQIAELRAYNASDLTAIENCSTVLYDCNKVGSKVRLNAIQMSKGVNMFESDGEYLYIMYDGGVIRVALDFADVRYESNARDYTVDSLDTSKYISFQLTGIDSRGGAYVKETDTFYIIDRSTVVHKFTGDMIDELKIGKTLDCPAVNAQQLPDVAKPSSALSYDAAANTGYVMYERTNQVTRLNFADETVDFTFKLEFNIDKIVYGSEPGDVYYIYKNVNETGQAEQNILVHTNIEEKRSEGVVTAVVTAGAVVCVVTALIALVLLVIVLRKREEQAAKTLKKVRQNKWVYVALIPSVILLCMFCYYEAIASIGLSFFDYTLENPTMVWNNFNNYIEVFTNAHAAEAFGNMVLFLVIDLIIAVVPPVLFAFFLTVLRWEKLSNFVRTMLFISGVIPSVAGMLVWRVGIYGGDGVLNTIIEAFGGDPIPFLGSTDTAKWSVLMIGFPFVGAYLIFYGGMMNIPKSYYEAAELEGIGIWRRFFSIDLPLVRPQLKYVVITSFIHSMQNFARTYMVTGGQYGTYTPVHLMYQKMLEGNYGLASAYATIIFVLLFFATFINMRSQKKGLED